MDVSRDDLVCLESSGPRQAPPINSTLQLKQNNEDISESANLQSSKEDRPETLDDLSEFAQSESTRSSSSLTLDQQRDPTLLLATRTERGFPATLDTLGQISLGSSFESLFLSHFTEVFGCSDSTTDVCAWVHLLPDLTTQSRHGAKSDALVTQWSIRASSMALYGALTKDPSFQQDACRWYAKSLNLQQHILVADYGSSDTHVKGGRHKSNAQSRKLYSYLVPPLMMCYYEVVTGSRNDGESDIAWAVHMEGAAHILKLLGGPRALRSSGSHVTRELYRTIRLGVLCTSTGKATSHFFSDKEWIDHALTKSQKRPFDYLLDILICLPRYLEQYRLIATSQTERMLPNLEARISSDILDRLQTWEQQNKASILSFSESLVRAPLSEHRILLGAIRVKNISAYILTAFCFAGYVYAYRILHDCSLIRQVQNNQCKEETAVGHLEQLSRYADAMLSIFIINRSATGNTHWAFPLTVVSSMALTSSQRELATHCLETLGKNAGVGSLEKVF